MTWSQIMGLQAGGLCSAEMTFWISFCGSALLWTASYYSKNSLVEIAFCLKQLSTTKIIKVLWIAHGFSWPKLEKLLLKKKKSSWILQPRNPVRILKVICHGSPQLGIGVPWELGKDSAVTSRNKHRGILNLECILQLLSKGFYAEKQVFQLWKAVFSEAVQ